jgi:hypothetical protein
VRQDYVLKDLTTPEPPCLGALEVLAGRLQTSSTVTTFFRPIAKLCSQLARSSTTDSPEHLCLLSTLLNHAGLEPFILKEAPPPLLASFSRALSDLLSRQPSALPKSDSLRAQAMFWCLVLSRQAPDIANEIRILRNMLPEAVSGLMEVDAALASALLCLALVLGCELVPNAAKEIAKWLLSDPANSHTPLGQALGDKKRSLTSTKPFERCSPHRGLCATRLRPSCSALPSWMTCRCPRATHRR